MINRDIEQKIEQHFKESRKPLMIFGARQIGKTTTCIKYGKENNDYLYFSLEKEIQIVELFETMSLSFEKIFFEISIILNTKITKNTIIIIDEIQVCPRAITALKYFYEEHIENNIIATGSFLGLEHMTQKSSFPVGKVELIEMHPATFKEFLGAIKEDILIDKLTNDLSNISSGVHARAFELFDTYIRVGGMPEAIVEYIESKDFIKIKKIHNAINMQYKIDFQKYADTPKVTSLLNTIYDSILPSMYENTKILVTDISTAGIRDLINPLEWLGASRIVIKCPIINNSSRPLIQQVKYNNFRLFFHDTGLLLANANYYLEDIKRQRDHIYKGLVAENYIAIVLNNKYKQCYNLRKGKTEIDFILDMSGNIIPIEVKNTKNISGKSLSFFINSNDLEIGYRFSRNEYNIENKIKEIPLYLAEFINIKNNIQ